ncbi:heterokaryon incompatibility protein-domain-containing protein [Hyaloscypha sp. PMI_1271]|nr:heterokaryon incompatibility protein-domain-containing protein [Hyaloscypha sp. PMI_1271]
MEGPDTTMIGIMKLQIDQEIGLGDMVTLAIGTMAGQLHISCKEGDPCSSVILSRTLQPFANSPEIFQLANAWIKDCHVVHPECASLIKTPKGGGKLPTRVVDVGYLNGSQHIRLVETTGQVGKWVALTYCWGNVPFLQTTSQNIKALKREIVFSSLPKTFQDAVVITRQLGIRYLWIDALCIQQNSELDWQTESANMPAIYANAYVTIAAVGAQNSHQGMLNPRGWAAEQPDSYTVQLSRKSAVDFRMPIDHLTHINFLSRRAWCLQEKVLSPRVLSFGSSQMTFTCSQSHLTEGNYVRDGQVQRDAFTTTKNELYLRVAQVSRGQFGTNLFYHVALRKLHRCWYGILTDYTQRTLTYPRDKLIAISGVADYIRRETSHEYLAGIWKGSLPQALLWQNPPSMKALFQEAGCLHFREKVATYRAPSWSWASVDGPVNFGDCVRDFEQPEIHRLSSKCDILECEVTAEGIDSCGQVSGGYITIHGPVRIATCEPSYGIMYCYEYNVAALLGVGPMFDENGEEIKEPVNKRDCMGVFDVKELPEGRQVWCLQVTTAFGLMLVPNLAEAGTFRRVGKCLLRCIGPERYVDWFGRSRKETVIIL